MNSHRVLLEASARSMPGRDRGIGRYLGEIVAANERLGNLVTEMTMPFPSGRLSEFLALARRQRAVRPSAFQIFHAPNPYLMSYLPDTATVVSILDVIPLEMRSHVKTGIKARFFYRLACQASVILTLSEHSASRIHQRLNVPEDRIVVAPLPAALAFTPDGPRATISVPYVVAMADLRTPDPRKRNHWLTPLSQGLGEAGVQLVVAGAGTERLSGPHTRGLGRVTDDRWASLLRGALFLAYTSAYEGQGMPPLETIACGTPAVAMKNSSIPEVVGAAGILIDEGRGDRDSLEAFVGTCCDLVFDQQRLDLLRTVCDVQASRFSTQRFDDSLSLAYAMSLDGLHS